MNKFNQHSIQINQSNLKDIISFSVFSCVLMLSMIEPASANVLDNLADTVLAILNNKFIRVMAIVAVMAVGFAAFTGRMDWGKGAMVMFGIVIVFGAAGIVDYVIANAGTV